MLWVAARRDEATLVLVVDQFEELYTLCAAGELAGFIDGVLALAEQPGVCLVLNVRADFYGLRHNQVLVGSMDADDLREAVCRPAAVVGLSVERALLVTVVRDAERRTAVLPLLSHAMLETWPRLRTWIAEHRDAMRVHRSLRVDPDLAEERAWPVNTGRWRPARSDTRCRGDRGRHPCG